MNFTAPGDIPMKPQAETRRGGKRVGGIAVSKTYDRGRCPGCDAKRSQYNPDRLCRLCAVRSEV